jgi:hypothetical protein
MATILKTKNSVTTTVAPTSLAQGELAVNITDKKMWVGNAATTPVQIVGAGATNRAGGSTTQVQYNSSGDLAGSANMTFNGTTFTLANDASISGLTVGKGVFTSNSGAGQVVLGDSAMASNTSGTNNTAIGTSALNANTTAYNNVAVGFQSLYLNTTGTQNTATGFRSLRSNTTGSLNAAFGQNALYGNTTGANNTALGEEALQANTTASFNTAVGYQAAYNNTGDQHTAIGYTALAANTTGVRNTVVGCTTLNGNTTGSYNTALGHSALSSNTTASNNTAVGYQAGYSNTTGTQNLFVGRQAGYSCTTVNSNTFVGDFSGYSTTGRANTFLGQGAGNAVTSGFKNTIIGVYDGNTGGLDIRTASNYIVLSDGDGNPRQVIDGSGNVLIGTVSQNVSGRVFNVYSASNVPASLYRGTTGTGDEVFEVRSNVGGTNTQTLKVTANGNVTNTNGSYSSYSDIKLKENIVDASAKLDKLNQIRIVNYNLIGNQEKHIGVIAQELEQICPSLIEESKDVDNDGNDLGTTTKGVKYSIFIPMLIKAVQELKAEVDSLKQQLGK